MIKTLLGQVGEYKKDSILTPVFTGGRGLYGDPHSICDRQNN